MPFSLTDKLFRNDSNISETGDVSSDDQMDLKSKTANAQEPSVVNSGVTDEGCDLLQTAKNIHATMSDLQSYIEEKKLEVSNEE